MVVVFVVSRNTGCGKVENLYAKDGRSGQSHYYAEESVIRSYEGCKGCGDLHVRINEFCIHCPNVASGNVVVMLSNVTHNSRP
jgi:hypothetical protein